MKPVLPKIMTFMLFRGVEQVGVDYESIWLGG